jgi:hypothetical protein
MSETHQSLTVNPDNHQVTPEIEPRFGTCVLIYVKPLDKYRFFLRDDKPDIPYPNTVCPIGGQWHPEVETAEEAARREISEEIVHVDGHTPFAVSKLKRIGILPQVNNRPGKIVMFGMVQEEDYNLKMLEGQGFVDLDDNEVKSIKNFPYGFTENIHKFVDRQERKNKLASAGHTLSNMILGGWSPVPTEESNTAVLPHYL